MRKAAMCFSQLQFPRYRIHSLTNCWWGSFPNIGKSGVPTSCKVVCSSKYRVQGRQYRRLSGQSVTSKPEGSKQDYQSSKIQIENYLLDETGSTRVNIYKPEIYVPEKRELSIIEQLIAEKKDLAELGTFVVFDIETTGICKTNNRIIEIAMRDLRGGENSVFQTLVNPGCYVPNAYVHGISTHMVNRPDVPRMEELIPILLQYIRSRLRPNGFVVLIAHNGRIFDVPFLSHEFSRCSYKFPSNIVYLDTISMARDIRKSKGLKGNSNISLKALVDFYNIPQHGPAHRALADVNSLAQVFQKLTFEMKLTIPEVLEKYHFTFNDLGSSKGKKSSSSK